MKPLIQSSSAPRPCCDALNRRHFLKQSALAAAALSAGLPAARAVGAAQPKPETLVEHLYESLTEGQRQTVCFPFDHELRTQVDNNWHITKPSIGEYFTRDQQDMILQIFRGVHSEEYADRVMRQVNEDAGSERLGQSSIALFGRPGTGKFEFVLTGRHVTRRCDGDSVEGAAFGGPVFYGHAGQNDNEEPHHPGNVYWYQAKRANEVFQMLDGKQRERALLDRARGERKRQTVVLTGKNEGLPGVRIADLSGDQKDHVRKVVADVLAPFREADVKESMNYIEAAGFDNLHMAFYRQGDIGGDGVWDIWQIEGPAMLMYFRGSPHVHAYIHIKNQA